MYWCAVKSGDLYYDTLLVRVFVAAKAGEYSEQVIDCPLMSSDRALGLNRVQITIYCRG